MRIEGVNRLYISPFPEIVKNFRCVFFDAYGVLNGAGGAFPWLADSLTELKKLNLPFYVVSNDSSNLLDGIAAKLNPKSGPAMIAEDQIISSGLICQNYVEKYLAGKALVYFGEQRSAGYLRAAGSVTHIRDMNLSEPAAAFVMLGCGGMDWRTGLDLSVNYIRNHPNCELLAPNPDLLFYAGDTRVGIAAGSLAGLVERSVNRPFRYFGKPHRVIFEFAYQRARDELGADLQPDEILMVGDNLFTDITGAKAMGFRSCLVLSGNTTAANFTHERDSSGVEPDCIAESIAF